MSKLRIEVPSQRAPRLPRDHFAMRPEVTLMQRVVRAIVLGGIAIALILVYRHH